MRLALTLALDFPEWLYLLSGWVVLLGLAALVLLAVDGAIRRLRR